LNNLIDSKDYTSIINKTKKELYQLKKEYGNTMSLEELRAISDADFGGLESDTPKK
jgi:hypothetical protein